MSKRVEGSADTRTLWDIFGLGGGTDNSRTMRGCCQLLLIVFLVFVAVGLLSLTAMVFSLYNRVNYYRYSIKATEFEVRPHVNASDRIYPPPFAHGYIDVDDTQFEVRWKLRDALGSGLPNPLASLDIRGPLNGKHADVAPVVLALGLHKKHNNFEDKMDIEQDFARHLVRNSADFYISFSDSTGREIARDYLNKQQLVPK